MIEVKEQLYSTKTLNILTQDAKESLRNPMKLNKVGNKFTDSHYTDLIAEPFAHLNCSHWYAAYFQHVTPVYPHTDNDNENMLYVGIIPLFWYVEEDSVSTILFKETSDTKIIYPNKDGFTEFVTFQWKQNTGVVFSSNIVHGSGNFTGIKTGIQIIGYR